ncbi:MAG: hypothetical protein ACTS73_09210 [Arsenophonus sp. NEOnobi-MAG3]
MLQVSCGTLATKLSGSVILHEVSISTTKNISAITTKKAGTQYKTR